MCASDIWDAFTSLDILLNFLGTWVGVSWIIYWAKAVWGLHFPWKAGRQSGKPFSYNAIFSPPFAWKCLNILYLWTLHSPSVFCWRNWFIFLYVFSLFVFVFLKRWFDAGHIRILSMIDHFVDFRSKDL